MISIELSTPELVNEELMPQRGAKLIKIAEIV